MSSVSDKLHTIKCQLACAASFLGVPLLEQDDLVRFLPTEVVPLETRTIIDQGVLSSISRIYQICGCEILDLVHRCRIMATGPSDQAPTEPNPRQQLTKEDSEAETKLVQAVISIVPDGDNPYIDHHKNITKNYKHFCRLLIRTALRSNGNALWIAEE